MLLLARLVHQACRIRAQLPHLLLLLLLLQLLFCPLHQAHKKQAQRRLLPLLLARPAHQACRKTVQLPLLLLLLLARPAHQACRKTVQLPLLLLLQMRPVHQTCREWAQRPQLLLLLQELVVEQHMFACTGAVAPAPDLCSWVCTEHAASTAAALLMCTLLQQEHAAAAAETAAVLHCCCSTAAGVLQHAVSWQALSGKEEQKPANDTKQRGQSASQILKAWQAELWCT
jgi:hypothetical protein